MASNPACANRCASPSGNRWLRFGSGSAMRGASSIRLVRSRRDRRPRRGARRVRLRPLPPDVQAEAMTPANAVLVGYIAAVVLVCGGVLTILAVLNRLSPDPKETHDAPADLRRVHGGRTRGLRHRAALVAES